MESIGLLGLFLIYWFLIYLVISVFYPTSLQIYGYLEYYSMTANMIKGLLVIIILFLPWILLALPSVFQGFR